MRTYGGKGVKVPHFQYLGNKKKGWYITAQASCNIYFNLNENNVLPSSVITFVVF
jgi:hypothetical protein